MHIVIVGPGALGCLLAATLHRGTTTTADRISLLDYNENRADRMNSQGIHYERQGITTRFTLPAYSNPLEVDRADALFICVKSYDVEETLDFCAPLMADDCLLIFMQNGIAHLKYRSVSKGAAAVFATTTEGSTYLGPGHVLHAGAGQTRLGFLDSPRPEHSLLLPRIVERLQAGGMKAGITESILTGIWRKLFVNVGINALTVIHDCKNGELLQIPEARKQMRQAINEAITVGEFENICVESALENTENVCRATAGNISSMLQDVRRKRKTEIDAINGMIVKMAGIHGLATPTNSSLVERVKEIEARY